MAGITRTHIRTTTRPLAVSGTNGRYLVDDAGRTVLLAGFHTWYTPQDGGTTDPPPEFDADDFYARAKARGANFVRLWTLENARDWPDISTHHYFAPSWYQRTGPGNALDGKPKFDLDLFDQDYFDRLRARVIQAAEHGMYASAMLFDGWTVERKGFSARNPWDSHPYNAANNINSLNGDPNNTGDGIQTHTLLHSAVTARQEAYVEKVVDTLNDLDNVIFEISNESDGGSTAWQYHLIDHIQAYEAGKPKQHLVYMTVEWPSGNNADLSAAGCHAQIISPRADSYDSMDVADGARVSILDTDHVTGLTDDEEWSWKAFCKGHHPLYMDEWNTLLYSGDLRNDATHERIRYGVGYILAAARRMPLALMTPQGALCSTGYCLARNHATAGTWFCYQDGSGAFTLNLATAEGTLSVEWIRPTTGARTAGGTISGGATRTLTPPFSGPAACVVRH